MPRSTGAGRTRRGPRGRLDPRRCSIILRGAPRSFPVHEAQLRRLAQQILEDLVPLDVVGLLHVFVPGGPGPEHLQHHPVVGVVLRLHEVQEDAPRLVQGVPTHRLQLRFRLRHPVLPRFDGDDEEEGAFRLGHAGFLHPLAPDSRASPRTTGGSRLAQSTWLPRFGGIMHRYLVVANQTLDSDELVALVRERTAEGPAEFWLVVPATPVKDLASNAMPVPMPVMGGVSTLPGPPEEARRLAQINLDAAVKKLTAAGGTVNGMVADPDPVRAVAEAVRGREFDEIIVFTLPPRLSRWLHQDLPTRLHHEFHLPVTDVVVRDL